MKTRAYLYIIVAGILWGLIGIFVRYLDSQGFTPLQIANLRALTAALGITPVLLVKDRGLFKISLRDSWMFFGTGVISLTCFNVCYFNCMQRSSLAVAALLLYTAPAFVMLLSLVLFKERFTLMKGVALLATFLGCALVTGTLAGELSISMVGLLFGLGSGIGYALYSVFGKYALRKYSTLTTTAYTFYFAFAATLPLADYAHCTASWNALSLVAILCIGVLCAFFPYVLYTKGLEYVEAGQASVLATVEPVMAAVVGVLVFAEPLTLDKICGMLLVVGAVIALNLSER